MTGTPLSSTSPPFPRHLEDDLFDRLRLLRSRRVGISTYRRMMHEHGTASAALAHLPSVAEQAGVKGYAICPEAVVKAELKEARRLGATLLDDRSPQYPTQLFDLNDAPPFLWCLGRLDLLAKPRIALVGARNASSLGTRMAKRLAQDLSEAGYIIVSGLARGVDAAAHHAALKGGTIAVQAGGVDVIYPAENTTLAKDIAKDGLRLSEMPLGQQPQARHFPARNRIIAGLAEAVVVVEAAGKSGSLITAKDALDLGRDVLAVPGHPFDARAAGCNLLIRDGAKLIRSAEDVIEALSPLYSAPELPLPPPEKPHRAITNLHQKILDRLGPSPLAEDQLFDDLHVDPDAVTPVLTELELSGKVTRDSGGLLVKAG